MAGIIVTMVTNLIRAGSSGADFKWQHGILCESIAPPAPTLGMHPPHLPTRSPQGPTHSRGLENATVEQCNNTAARCATVYPTCHSKEPFSSAETCYPAILTNTSWGPGGVDGCIQFLFLQLWSLLEGASRLNNSPAVAFKTERPQTELARSRPCRNGVGGVWGAGGRICHPQLHLMLQPPRNLGNWLE